jgi:hypothetical protein
VVCHSLEKMTGVALKAREEGGEAGVAGRLAMPLPTIAIHIPP